MEPPVLITTTALSGANDPTASLREQVESLLERARRADGSRALSDHHWIDFQAGGGPGYLGAITHGMAGGERTVLGYGQVSSTTAARAVEIVVDPRVDEPDELTEHLLTTLLDAIARDGGGTTTWWVTDAASTHAAIASRAELSPDRELLQMRRPLPTGLPVSIETRAFVPGHDDERWVEVNNRAFAGHGEQGGWSLELLRSRFAEPWFDPGGFLLHERDGRLAGFCWTKLHLDVSPVLGEIYVIAVDPDFHGEGLGAQLTLAGLESIHDRGVEVGMLYVDGGNTPAVSLYRKLGFEVHRADRAFTADLPASSGR